MNKKKNPWADFDKQIELDRKKENELIKQKFSKEKLVKIALNFALKQDFQKALDYFKLVTEKEPKHFLAWVNMGIIYTYHNLLGTTKGRRTAYYKRHYDEGIECFKKALELKPNDIPSLIGLGDAFRGKKEFTKSIEYFDRIIKIAPKNSESWGGIGFAYLEMMEFEKAINYFEKATKIEDKNVDSWIGLGISYFERKNLDESLNCFMNAINYQKQQEKPKKDFIGREIYSNKLETIAKVIIYIESEKVNLAFINKIEKEFDIKFESKPSILTFFEDTQSKTANQDLIIKKDEELTNSDSKDIKMDRISVLEKKLLTSENENERLTAATELKKIGKEKARLALLKAYKDKSDKVRMKVIETIENSKDIENIPYLLKLLEDESSKIRERSIKTLGKIGNSEILPYFLKKLIDPDEYVRVYAADAIGKFGDVNAVKYLILCLKKPERSSVVIRNIIWALGNIGDNSQLDLLIKWLKIDKESTDIRSEIALALSKIGGEKAFNALLEILNTEDWDKYLGNAFKAFKKNIIISLANFKNEKLTDSFINMFEREMQNSRKSDIDIEIITSLIESLGLIGDNKITEILMKTLYDVNEKIRLASVKSLAKLNDNNVNEKLISMLVDDAETTPFKRKIINSLNELNKDDTVSLLNQLNKIQDKEGITIEEQIKNNQKIITIKDKKSRVQIGKISYHLSEKEIKEIEVSEKEIKEIEEKKRRNAEELKKKAKDIEFNTKYKELETLVDKYNLRKLFQINNYNDASKFLNERGRIVSDLAQLYRKFKDIEELKNKLIDLVLKYYSQYLDFNPFNVKVQYSSSLTSTYSSCKKSDINALKSHWKNNIKLQNLYNKLNELNNKTLINKQLSKIAEETKILTYNVPIENMYDFLLDFSQIIPDPQMSKIQGANEDEYTLEVQMGNLYFKIIEKELNKKLTYQYDFLTTAWGERGTFFITFDEPNPGSVELSIRNEIQEISKSNVEILCISNVLGDFLKTYLDFNLGKVIAKQVQTIFYEKTFDDLTMGNYKILQAKFNTLGKDINELKARFFEVKSPLTLNSFECSECGATLNITSKEEKFIICDHCSTPFLMEWQKE